MRRPEHPGPVESTHRGLGTSILVICYLSTVVIMWMLKQHYSSASAEQLRWVLHPVAGLAAWLGGSDYAWEAGIGYVRSDHRFTIAPACAGLNFMLMTFGLTVSAFLHQCRSNAGRIAFTTGALAGAYLLTLLVNALRIVLSVKLYELEIAWGWLPPERLHRLAGVAVYFSALGLYYGALKRIITRKCTRFPCHPKIYTLLPWGWYVVGALAVPTVNRIVHGRGLPDPEHWLTVLVTSALLWCIGLAGLSLLKSRRS